MFRKWVNASGNLYALKNVSKIGNLNPTTFILFIYLLFIRIKAWLDFSW